MTPQDISHTNINNYKISLIQIVENYKGKLETTHTETPEQLWGPIDYYFQPKLH